MANKFLKNEEWIKMIQNMLQYRVQRYPQIIQSLMFLTGSHREAICLPETNKLCWKWIREIRTDQIPKAMLNYQMYGETKGRQIVAYQTLPYCERIIEGINAEEVEQYHVGLGKLFKWLLTAIAGRKLDITRRKILKRKEKEDRQQKIEREEDRKTRREEFLLESRAEWEEEEKDNIDAWKQEKDRQRRREEGAVVSGDEDDDDDGDDGKPKTPLEEPVFKEAEKLMIFD